MTQSQWVPIMFNIILNTSIMVSLIHCHFSQFRKKNLTFLSATYWNEPTGWTVSQNLYNNDTKSLQKFIYTGNVNEEFSKYVTRKLAIL